MVVFPAAADVRPGSAVECNGIRIGTVGTVELTNAGKLLAELLLYPDTRITHAMLPFAFPPGVATTAPPVEFVPWPAEELSLIYGDEVAIIDTPYLDGEYSNWGRVWEQ